MLLMRVNRLGPTQTYAQKSTGWVRVERTRKSPTVSSSVLRAFSLLVILFTNNQRFFLRFYHLPCLLFQTCRVKRLGPTHKYASKPTS